jgi:hypothetical protein
MQMTKILFPTYSKNIRYYDIHYRYLLNIFQVLNWDIEFIWTPDLKENSFEIIIDDLPILIDFNDHLEVSKWIKRYPICFKYHYSKEHHSQYKNMYPIGPVSFYDWQAYSMLREKFRYKCSNDMILNNQRPYADATKRRRKVRKMLKGAYGDKVDTRFYQDKNHFWNLVGECMVSVCVPGARNDILDRGQFQSMALGCCTISPKLNTVLSNNRCLQGGIHYMVCKSDYSNLLEVIECCRGNRQICSKIGSDAAKLFEETSTPEKIGGWIQQNLER